MKWNHILDKQPIDNSTIIQLDAPYKDPTYKDGWDKHYPMGMMRYCNGGQSWEEFLKISREQGWKDPNFWWIYAKDFPFPDQTQSQCEKPCELCTARNKSNHIVKVKK